MILNYIKMVYLIYGLWIDPLPHWKKIFIDITNHVNIIRPKTTVLQYHVAFRGSAKPTNPFPFFLRLFDKILRGMLVHLSFMRKLLVGLKACESFAVFGCDQPVSHVLDISMP